MARVKGSGTIEKRANNKWLIRVSMGVSPLTGKQIRPSKTINGTKADARKALNAWIAELENGLKVDAEKILFEEYALRVHRQREAIGGYSPTTMRGELNIIKRLCKLIGGVRICDMDSQFIKEFYSRLRTEQGFGKSSLTEAHKAIKATLEEAVNDGIILRNPCLSIHIGRIKPKNERRALSIENVHKLVQCLNDYDMQQLVEGSRQDSRTVAIRIILATGIRRAELCGLLWDCVDLKKGVISVKRQYSADLTLRAPKSAAGVREIPIDSETVAMLEEWKETQQEAFLSLSKEFHIRGTKHELKQVAKTPVITNYIGEIMSPYRLSEWFQGFCIKYGFGGTQATTNSAGKMIQKYEGLKLHELRHTQATLLIANGVDIKTVQERLGHSSASQSLGYTHTVEKNRREAADLIGFILGENSEK